jgi:deazaflavin-dependent oxidoreductase (nitroreductase family)
MQEGAMDMTAHIERTSRAPWWVTTFGPITKRLLAAGVPLGFNGLLTVPGRTTGVPRTTPVAIIADGSGRRWVWAPWGDVQWVRNLRAAGRATITLRGRREEVAAVEQDRAQRVIFFRDTLPPIARRIPFGVSFIRVVDGTDLADPEVAADGRPVFELRAL